MKLFKNRTAAGLLLAQRLKNTKADLMLAIPRGGVVVASEIARKLKLPLDIIVTRKIGAPMQEELALGAIDPDGDVVWEQALLAELRIKNYELRDEIQKEWEEIKRREDLYRAGKKPYELDGKTVILVDDGIATGSTMIAAVNYLKRHKVKEIILAIPVCSKESADKISKKLKGFGQLIVLQTPDYFQAVGQFYQSFLPVSDDMVIEYLNHGR